MVIFKNVLKKFELDLCGADSPSEEILLKRKNSLTKFTQSMDESNIEESLPDLEFSKNYRVPFPFVDQILKLNQTSLLKNKDLSEHDAFSSYGVNVFGKEVYEMCIKNSVVQNEEYGFFLNSIHPVTLENIEILKEISGMDAVSFHMSGTEAVLNACRLAKFNTDRKYILKFKDAYHGWAGITDLKEITSLKELKNSSNCAALLLNPLQFLFPKNSIKADALLFIGNEPNRMSLQEYIDYLQDIRKICDEKGIILILDEVFLGFRLAYGGCQEYFNIKADMVLYGKTLGGGLPVGVVCGKKEYMNKMDSKYPLKFLPNRGTFSAHPLVMLSMNQFLKYITREMYSGLDSKWNIRIFKLNEKLSKYSIKFQNLGSIISINHDNLSIYNWILQLYFKKNKLYLGPYGSSRLIFQINLSDTEWTQIEKIIINSIQEMEEDGWFYSRFKSKKEIYLFYIKNIIKETFKNVNN